MHGHAAARADRRRVIAMSWTVYLLVSSTRTYVGITTELRRRLDQHNGKRRGGARATRGRGPWRVAAQWGPFDTRSAALRVEHQVKRLRGRRRSTWQPPA